MMNDIFDAFERLKTQFLAAIPGIIASLFVLLIGYLLGRLVKYLIIRLFRYISKITGPRFQRFNLKRAGYYLGTAFFWLIIFFSVIIVTEILDLLVLTRWFQGIASYIPNVVAAVFIVFAAVVLGNLVVDALLSLSRRTGTKYSTALLKTVRYLLLLLGIIIALDQIGVQIALLIDVIDIFLAALLFGGALAFALGSKNSVSNILACYYLRRRYQEGDEIQIGKIRGIIIKIDAVSVVLENEVGQITIPAKMFSENESYLITKSSI